MLQRMRRVISVLLLFCCSAPAFAYIDFYAMHTNPLHFNPLFSLGGGAYFTIRNANNSQNFPIIDPVTDEFYSYQGSSPNNPQYLFSIYLANQFVINQEWAFQAGVDYAQSGMFQTRGTLTQGADVLSEDVYQYYYNIQTRQLLAEGKLLYQFKQNTRVHPYLLLGLGVAFNSATDYNTTAPDFVVFTRQYQNRTTSSFSYNVGAGIDVDVTYNVSLGLGYRFASLGQVSLGDASINGQGVAGSISQSNLYANEFMAQLSYFPFQEQYRV